MRTANIRLDAVVSLYRTGDYDEAHQLVSQYLSTAPNDGKLWEMCGLIRHATRDCLGAIDALEQAVVLVPLSAAGQCILAQCYISVGHEQLANEMLRFLLDISRLPPKLLPLISNGFARLGELQLALEACRRAAQHELDGGEPFFGMAHYMERLEYPLERVCAMLEKAIELEPDRFRYRLALAKTYQRQGKDNEAYAVVRKADRAEIAGLRCADCLSRLTQLYQAAGDVDRANCCQQQLAEISK